MISKRLSSQVRRIIHRLKERVANRPHARAVAGTASTNVAITLLGSAAGLLFARVLGPTYRGDLAVILQWPATIGTLASVGITESTCYFVARRPIEARSIMWTATAAALLTGLVLAIAGPWIASVIGRNDQVVEPLTWIFALSPLYIAGGVWLSTLQATSIRHWNVSRLSQPLIYFFGAVVLWWVGALTLVGAVVVFAASLVIQSLYLLIRSRHEVGSFSRPQARWLGPLYGYGTKVFLTTVPRLVNWNLDLLLLSIWPGVTAAKLGNYVVAVSLSSLVSPVAQAFGSIAFPRIARAHEESDRQRIERLSLIGTGVSSGLIITAVCVAAPVVVPVLLGHGYHSSIVALWILAPGAIFLAMNQTLTAILQGRGRPLVASVAEGIGAICTVLLLTLLIPHFGINGAAAASTMAYGITMSYLLWERHRTRVSLIHDESR